MELDRRQFLKAGACVTGAMALSSMGVSRLAVAAPKLITAKPTDVAMLVDISKCVGCWRCYYACQECNDLSGTTDPTLQNAPKLNPNVWVTLRTSETNDRWKYWRQACMHCTDASCVNICPTGAVSHHPLGFVQFDKSKCSGCGFCVEHCPFSIPQLEGNQVTGFTQMRKCIFCEELVSNGGVPACAAACPTGATTFGNRDDLLIKGQQRVAEINLTRNGANLYGADQLGGLHVMYVLLDKPEVYGFPTNPSVPQDIGLHNILEKVGLGSLALAVAGLGMNYLTARTRMLKEAEKGAKK